MPINADQNCGINPNADQYSFFLMLFLCMVLDLPGYNFTARVRMLRLTWGRPIDQNLALIEGVLYVYMNELEIFQNRQYIFVSVFPFTSETIIVSTNSLGICEAKVKQNTIIHIQKCNVDDMLARVKLKGHLVNHPLKSLSKQFL